MRRKDYHFWPVLAQKSVHNSEPPPQTDDLPVRNLTRLSQAKLSREQSLLHHARTAAKTLPNLPELQAGDIGVGTARIA